MTTDLTLYTPPSASDLEHYWRLSERIGRTEFVPVGLRGKPEAVLACILAGRELGIGPMQALQSIHIIQGRPTISADLMVGLVRWRGHRIRTIERTNDLATVEGVRADDPEHVESVTFTMDDAKRAGLNGKDNWRQYPAAMLWARAVSALCRIAFNDVLHGVAYTPEEINPDTPASTTVEAGPVEIDGVVRQFDADGEHGAAQVDRSGLPLPEIIAAIRQPEQAHHLLKDPDLSEDYRQAVRRTVQGDGLNWSSFWRTASPLAWRTILDRALTEQMHQSSRQPSDPDPSAPPRATGSEPGEGERATNGERRDDPSPGTQSPEPNPSPTAAAGSGAPRPASTTPEAGKPGRGARARHEGKRDEPAAPAGPQRTSERGVATDATSSVKQAGSVDPTEGNREGTDPSLLPEPPGWEQP